jgi:hypothetical protein
MQQQQLCTASNNCCMLAPAAGAACFNNPGVCLLLKAVIKHDGVAEHLLSPLRSAGRRATPPRTSQGEVLLQHCQEGLQQRRLQHSAGHY